MRPGDFRPGDFGPPAEDEARPASRRAAGSRWDAESLYTRDDEPYARDDLRGAAYRDEDHGAETLNSVASWIERAQQQIQQTAEAASRLEAAARERRPEREEGSIADALAAIRRIEGRLDGAQERHPSGPGPSDIEKSLRSFEARLGDIAERLEASPKAAARRPLKPGQHLKSAVDEIRFHQSRLEGDPLGERRPQGLPALGTLARSQTAMLTTLRQEVAKLASRMDDVPRGGVDQQVRREVETLRQSMEEVARRGDLSRLENGLHALTEDIMELRRAGEKSSAGAEIAALQAEIRRLSEHRSEPDFAELQAEIRRLSERRTPPAVDFTPIARDIQSLSRKLDRLAEGGVAPAAVASLAGQIENVRQILTEAAAPRALDIVDQQLSAMRREIAEIGGRQVGSREFEALRGTLDDLRASLEGLSRSAGSRDEISRAVREFGQPIEHTLTSLVDKIERVERRVSDPEALDHLERQIEALAVRLGETPSRDPSIAALERSMGDILDQVSSWRAGAVEAAEHAARTAVAETLDAMPVAAEVERHLVEIGDRYAAAEERTRQSLASVHSSLSDVMGRLVSLETGTAAQPAPFQPRLDERAGAPAPVRGAPPSEADIPFAPPPDDEVLLEPGAARPSVRSRGPGLPRQGQPGPEAAAAAALDSPDIKSSFIAAARRAAQAAAAESQAAAKSRPAPKAGQSGGMSPSDLVGRVRRLIDSKRRPLLLAAAAIVLALGTMQIVRTQMSDRGPAAVVAVAPTAPAAPRPANGGPAADSVADRAEVTAATTPAPSPLPDPTTTQSITPAPASPAPLAALPEPPPAASAAAAGPKEPARIAEAPSAALATLARTANAGEPSTLLPTGIKQAADRGDPVALYELGARTADGRGVPRDAKAAAALFAKAADKGLAPAQYRLGNAYERGIGVQRDLEQAKSWYRRAAMGGNVRAMHNLAVLLADGGGAKPDYAGAIEWFSRAAEHGVKDSQFNLAVLYARGLGTSQNLARAYHWLAIAARQGDEDAGRKRDEVGQRLAAPDLAKAKAGVEAWQPAPAAVSANEVLMPPQGFPEPVSAGKRHSREARV